MRVTAEKMVAGGKCLCRADGKAVFVPGMLPGETAEIRITKARKDYDEAEIERILEAAPGRTEPPCPHAALCGGCSLMHAESGLQTELRKGILRDLLARSGCGCGAEIELLPSEPFGYRSRFQFHRTEDGAPGFCAKGSNAVVPVRDCPVAVPEIRELLASGELGERAARMPGKERLHVFAYGGKAAVESPVEAENSFSLRLNGKEITFDIRAFFQSNVPAFEKAAALALSGPGFAGADTADDARKKGNGAFLDFYAGCGVFSVLARERFRRLVLVEENAASVSSAKVNLASSSGSGRSGLKTEASFFCTRDSRWLKTKEARGEFEAAVIDPPRTGIGKPVLEWLATAKIGALRYLSCEPSTFARDAAALAARGWKADRVVLCDFYPQTHHIETLGFFSRTG